MQDRREHPPETVWQAQELYCVARLPMDEVAKEVGVATSTLWRWCNAYGWRDKREKLARAQAEIRADMVLARAGMIKSLMDGKDPMVGFAVAKLEQVAMQQAEAERAGKLAAQTAQAAQAGSVAALKPIAALEDAVPALQDAIQARLAQMLADPAQVSLKAIQELQKAFGFVEQLKASASPAEDRKGLTPETADKIRRDILGLA